MPKATFALLLLFVFNCPAVSAEGVEQSISVTRKVSKPETTVEGPKDVNLFAVEPKVIAEPVWLPAVDIGTITEDKRIRTMLKCRAELK